MHSINPTTGSSTKAATVSGQYPASSPSKARYHTGGGGGGGRANQKTDNSILEPSGPGAMASDPSINANARKRGIQGVKKQAGSNYSNVIGATQLVALAAWPTPRQINHTHWVAELAQGIATAATSPKQNTRTGNASWSKVGTVQQQ